METSRCRLVKLNENDFEDVKKIYRNEEVRKYLGGAIAEEHTSNKFLDALERSEKESKAWVVRLKSNDDFIGLVSLDNHVDGEDTEVSYELMPNSWGVGYATEVISQIIAFAFKDLSLSKLIAETQTANFASCRLLERVGMKLEKKVLRYGAEQVIYMIEKTRVNNECSKRSFRGYQWMA